MKVLIVFNHPAPYKVLSFNELSKHVDLTVLFERTKAKDRPDEFYSKNNYEFKSIVLTDSYIGNEGSLSNKVRNYIKEHHQEFDLIVMNGYSHAAEFKAIRYMVKHDIPFTLLINGGVIHNKEIFIKKLFKKSLVSPASYYISPSKKSDEYLIYYGANPDKIFRYPYSNISINEIVQSAPDKKSIREKHNLPLDKKIFVNASQFISRKNNMQLLSIFKNRNEHLLLIGDGKEKEDYLNFIKINSFNNITIMPFKEKEELFEILKGCDAFITLAKEDIFGHTILEALACGLPVVSSNKVNSALEFIENGKNGYIVSLDNNEEINTAIDKVIDIPFENTIKTVKGYTVEASGRELAKIFEELHG